MKMRVLVSLSGVILIAGPAVAQTFLSGELPAVLEASGNPFIAISDLTISNSTVDVEPGVELNFTSDTRLEFRGGGSSALQLLGTPSAPIVLQGWLADEWWGVVDAEGTTVVLDAEWIEILGGSQGIKIEGSAPHTISISEGSVSGSGSYGVRVQNAADVVMNNVSVSDRFRGIELEQNASVDLTGCAASACATGFLVQGSVDGSVRLAGLSAFTCSSTGLELKGFVQSEGLLAQDCEVGIKLVATGAITLDSSTSTSNLVGISVSSGGGVAPIVTGTTVAGNQEHGVAFGAPAVFSDCSIFDNEIYDVHVNTQIVTYLEIDMRNCFWGSETTAEMLAEGTFSDIEAIFDFWDDSSRSLVNFEGFVVPVSAPEGSWSEASLGVIKAKYRTR